MTLSEIQKARNDLENKIAQTLEEFTRTTGCPIASIEVNRMDMTRHDGDALRHNYGYAPPRINLEIP